MLLHAFAGRAGAGQILAAADAGPLAGLGALPDLRIIRPELAALADRGHPVSRA